MLIILLTLISIRPFISSLAFPYLNYAYSVLFIAFLISWIITKKISLERIKPLTYPLALLCLALIVSTIFSLNKINTFGQLYQYVNGLLLFFVAASLCHEDKIRVIRTAIFSGFVISVLAIYQYLFGFQHLLNYMSAEKITNAFALDYVERRRTFFPFVTPNILAGYLAMVIPLALTGSKKRWLGISASVVALLLTRSLGALLSLFLALVIYFYLRNKSKRRILILLSLGLAVIGVIFVIRTCVHKEHLQPVFSAIARLGYWRESIEIIKARPLTGIGIGNFNLVWSRYAHNSYLQIWAEMGILGIISILWLIIAIFKTAPKNLKDAAYTKETAGIITAIAVFLIHNFVDFSFFLPEVSLIWWGILGLSVGLLRSNGECL